MLQLEAVISTNGRACSHLVVGHWSISPDADHENLLANVQHPLDSRQLVEVRSECRAAPMPVSLVNPNILRRSRRLNAFIERFEAPMRPHFELMRQAAKVWNGTSHV